MQMLGTAGMYNDVKKEALTYRGCMAETFRLTIALAFVCVGVH